MLGTIVVILLIVVLVAGLPTWGYSREWGYRPTGITSGLLALVLILILLGIVPL